MARKVYEESKVSKEDVVEYRKPYALEETDCRILRVLCKNARQSLAELSRDSGLTRDVIGYRIKKLVADKLILGFRPVFNPPSLGLQEINHVYFLLAPESIEQEEKFISHLKGLKNVVTVVSLVGKWELMATIVAQTPAEFNQILKEIRIKHSGLIKDFEVMSLLLEHKHDDYSGLF